MSKQITVTIKRTQVTSIWVPDDFNMNAPYIETELSEEAYEELSEGQWNFDSTDNSYTFTDVPLAECESDCEAHSGQVAWTEVGAYGSQQKNFLCLTARNADIEAGNRVCRMDGGQDNE